MSCNDQGTEFEFTVVQKYNQGSFPKSGVIDFGAFFLFLFWRSKKEKYLILEIPLNNITFLKYFNCIMR